MNAVKHTKATVAAAAYPDTADSSGLPQLTGNENSLIYCLLLPLNPFLEIKINTSSFLQCFKRLTEVAKHCEHLCK